MRVLLVRHAAAVSPDEAGGDAERWLSPEGRTSMQAVATEIRGFGLSFDRILTSPLVRAVQTAELLALGTGFAGAAEATSVLVKGTTAAAAALLNGMAADAQIALVGHEPSIRILAGHLLGAGSLAPFHTGMACLVRWHQGRGELEWFLDPRSLRRIESIDGLTS